MKYLMTLTAALALTTACKTSNSQLQEDLYFPDNEDPGKAGYLTWVVGEKPADSSADNRHICRAICKTDPVPKSEEVGYDKLNEVRSSCEQEGARSISFAKLNESDEYKGVVEFADGNQAVEHLTPFEDKVVLAEMLRVWQDGKNSYPTSGVMTVKNVTEINIRREAVVGSLFSDDNLIYLDPAIEAARDDHNKKSERALEQGFIEKMDWYEVPADSKRVADACFSASVKGNPTKANEKEKAAGESEAASDKWEAESLNASKAVLINDKFVYQFFKESFGQCLSRQPTAEIGMTVDGKDLKFLFESAANGFQLRRVWPEPADEPIITFTPENNIVKVAKDGAEVASFPSKALNDTLQLWLRQFTLRLPVDDGSTDTRRPAPIQCAGPTEGGWIRIQAILRIGYTQAAKTLTIGFVRFKSEGGTGAGRIEFSDPKPSVEDQAGSK